MRSWIWEDDCFGYQEDGCFGRRRTSAFLVGVHDWWVPYMGGNMARVGGYIPWKGEEKSQRGIHMFRSVPMYDSSSLSVVHSSWYTP